MPRRNRNAHATTINADELADQAEQLTAELGTVNGITAYLLDDIRFYRISAIGAGKSAILHDYFTKWSKERPGCKLVVIDRKRELAEVVTSNGRS
jgi:hypothetical protein